MGKDNSPNDAHVMVTNRLRFLLRNPHYDIDTSGVDIETKLNIMSGLYESKEFLQKMESWNRRLKYGAISLFIKLFMFDIGHLTYREDITRILALDLLNIINAVSVHLDKLNAKFGKGTPAYKIYRNMLDDLNRYFKHGETANALFDDEIQMDWGAEFVEATNQSVIHVGGTTAGTETGSETDRTIDISFMKYFITLGREIPEFNLNPALDDIKELILSYYNSLLSEVPISDVCGANTTTSKLSVRMRRITYRTLRLSSKHCKAIVDQNFDKFTCGHIAHLRALYTIMTKNRVLKEICPAISVFSLYDYVDENLCEEHLMFFVYFLVFVLINNASAQRRPTESSRIERFMYNELQVMMVKLQRRSEGLTERPPKEPPAATVAAAATDNERNSVQSEQGNPQETTTYPLHDAEDAEPTQGGTRRFRTRRPRKRGRN